ncbi:MAG TPA: hypothetical protein VNA25_14685 [Phycisphaerae bacterium]|nr:hypothetical protein [Phycisphaerae bacterium]
MILCDYQRQCRNSAAWRAAQHAPAECPYGLPLNSLPIGDNAPALLARILPGPDCRHAHRLTCCKVECLHTVGLGLTFSNAHCAPSACTYYEVTDG